MVTEFQEKMNKNIRAVGNKAHKLAKLAEIYDGDEVDVEELEVDGEAASAQQQIEELRGAILDLTRTVGELVTSRRNVGAETTSEVQQPTTCLPTPANGDGVPTITAGTTQTLQIRPNSRREIYALMPEYDPLKNNLSSEVFIEKVTQLRRAYELTEQETLVAAQSKLKGVAKEWLDSQEVFQSWLDFVQAFEHDFPASITSAQVHRNMSQRKRQSRETFEEYYYVMLSMGRRGKMDEESINAYIISGLNDAMLSRTLLALKLPTCNDLLRSLKGMIVGPTQPRVSSSDEKNTSETGSRATMDRQPMKCFNCNQYGHIAAKCQQPQRKPKCSKCNKMGHEAQACRSERPTVANIVEDSKQKTNAASKDVVLNGKTFRGFIDTGSDVSLIAASKVPEEATRTSSIKQLEGFGGAVIASTAVVDAELVVDGATIWTPCHIVPDEVMHYDIVIGRDVLCKGNCRLTIESGVMQVHQRSEIPFIINEDLDEADSQGMRTMLQQYGSCFSESLTELGRCKTTQMEILVTTDQPVMGRQYQVPLYQRPVLAKIISDLLDNGIIRPSSSPHAAPVIIVKKSNGEDRMCVDYRALNAVTLKKHFPMPIVEEQLAKLVGNMVFTTLDMTAGYYQIPVKEESKPYTAFLTPEGLFEHNVMPFGLRNAPMVFQEMITKMIRGLKHRDKIVSYVDEVIIATKTVEQNIQVVSEFFASGQRIRSYITAVEMQLSGN
ncbi:uncharacterized protein K02A2.6-like [Rhagoletis pomonella]|uniref:uncharacterized protein K02A2.6-like n=1 Tax=Rhagoletis pomonella TaxID=28610 RepID=UPI00177D9ECB|nr:uncharacterized protein K02A2.6-like [Rhagoletis pomonella]